MNYAILKAGAVFEVHAWAGPAFAIGEAAQLSLEREAFRQRLLARAYEVGGLAYEVRSPEWKESIHRDFPCREVAKRQVAVVTPVGTFRFAAQRRAGQESLPVRAHGRLNPPCPWRQGWTWQPSAFTYADGASSDFLGSAPMAVTWVGDAPEWDLAEE